MNELKIQKTENDGRQWYAISGIHFGTNFEFDGEIYGEAEDGAILDSEGYPLTPGDGEYIAVSHAIASLKKG